MDLSWRPTPERSRLSPLIQVAPHDRSLPLNIGTRGSPLALTQTRNVIDKLRKICPALRGEGIAETIITTSGDASQASGCRLAEIGGKGLFSKEIDAAMLAGKIDIAVHSLKDLETVMRPGIVIGCVLARADARDVLILGPDSRAADPQAPWDSLPYGAVVGTASVRRQAQLLHARPDLKIGVIRGNVQTRLNKVHQGAFAATMLAYAGLQRLDLADQASIVIAPSIMVPAAGQGIVGITVRETDTQMRELLAAIEDRESRAVSDAERSMLSVLDGSCNTPIGAHAVISDSGTLHLTGLLASVDGCFLVRQELSGSMKDAVQIGATLGTMLKQDAPSWIFN